MTKKMMICGAIVLTLLQTAQAQYTGWSHSGSLAILTTPEGADLPATVSEENFPLLVRLNKEWFNFTQAKAKGDDLRFSADNKPLAYQIEEWDAAAGTASIWVRIPLIKGNARQELKMFWGKADAKDESSGKAVFNESNGFVTVMHLNDSVADEVGTLAPVNCGGVPVAGMIGKSMNFVYGKGGVIGGESISNYPSGNTPSSTGFWFKDNKMPGPWGSRFVCWGVEGSGSKLLMGVLSPLHISAGLDCTGGVNMGQWYHVTHTYAPDGTQKAYINGQLNATGKDIMDFKKPTRMYIAGWWRNWESDCDVDEVRISKVTRSADWVRMEYENQKPSQTLVGLLPQTGNAFSVSPAVIQVEEGKSVTVTAQAGGAQKVYWTLKRDGAESLVGVDQFAYTFDAGRVVADTTGVLRFKAVFASGVKVKEIPVTIKEAIPEPVFTLKAPTKWNGRDMIEVLPVISNLKAMEAKGAAKLTYTWLLSGGAVIKEIAADRLLLKRSQFSGPLTVKATISNGGAERTASTVLQVAEPPSDPWVERIPGKDEKPQDNQFYARNDKNEGMLYYNGALSNAVDAVFIKLYADDKLIKTESQKLAADKSYALSLKLKPGLIKYKIAFGTKSGSAETVLHTATNLVCGDAYLIDGQSNALATDTGEESPRDTSEWIRSYANTHHYRAGEAQNLWCYPVWKAQGEHKAELGWWGMELAKRLVASQKVPVFMINAAVGGTRIDQHLRNEANPEDLNTIYGRMLWRMRQAHMTHGIRAVLWHQGESDQGTAGPGGGYGWEVYQQQFIELSASWKQDLPNIRHYYVYQIWPNSCSMGGGHGDMMREVQRTLSRLYSNMDVIPTLGITPPGPAHFPLAGWSKFAELVQPLIERDFYGRKIVAPITAPNLKRACYSGATKDAITLEFDQPVVWTDSLVNEFYLDNVKEKVASGSVTGNLLTLKLKAPAAAKTITYLHEMAWSQERLLVGKNGIAALTFCEVGIERE